MSLRTYTADFSPKFHTAINDWSLNLEPALYISVFLYFGNNSILHILIKALECLVRKKPTLKI